MFKNLLITDFFEVISDNAKNGIIKNDRMKYQPIFEVVEQILSDDDKIIISDVNLIINKKKYIMEQMIIYTIFTRRTSTLIANTIHKNFGKYVKMNEIIPIEEYEISYNLRNLIKIYHIDKYKNVNIPNLFNSIKINQLYYFPSEIELMDIYHKLYLPNEYDNWNQLIKYEKILYDKVIEKFGGAKCNECKDQRKLDINNIKILLLNFLDNENYIMVGKWAHNIITEEKKIDNNYNIQIISENDIEHDYYNIVNYLSSYTKYGIYYKKKKLYIPKDNRIYKYTFFIKYPIIGKSSSDIDKQFLDIYNCTSFELVPYMPKKYNELTLNIGNLFVQLRFLLIDLWLIRLLKYLNIVGSSQFTYKHTDIFSMIILLKSKLKSNFTDKYMGIYYDEKIQQKIIISKKQIRKTSYFPEISIIKDKKYKIIATSS